MLPCMHSQRRADKEPRVGAQLLGAAQELQYAEAVVVARPVA